MADASLEPLSSRAAGCALCDTAGGAVVWSDAAWRVVRVDDDAFPAFYRVIAQHHVAEFSQVPAPERERCMGLVCAIERCLIEHLRPTKVNLAALGNVVPHLHWHVVARFEWDSHFPQPIWGERQRTLASGEAARRLAVSLESLDAGVVQALTNA